MFADIHIRSHYPHKVDLGYLRRIFAKNEDCANDHGERTNRKLKDQPFYQRAHNGKMRKY